MTNQQSHSRNVHGFFPSFQPKGPRFCLTRTSWDLPFNSSDAGHWNSRWPFYISSAVCGPWSPGPLEMAAGLLFTGRYGLSGAIALAAAAKQISGVRAQTRSYIGNEDLKKRSKVRHPIVYGLIHWPKGFHWWTVEITQMDLPSRLFVGCPA